MATLTDLESAISNVLYSADYDLCSDSLYMRIPIVELKILQAEYNIHFVEPNKPQLDAIKCKTSTE